ncbi:hypothetical protein ACFQ48_12965 [Hymenobacter caeli]|uniref:PH domain-containing protein n=1 Tax=Hymenobacter caeli TaxID=2735894 RepID=A0ABX2FSS5_9BACT|nr:hypothetical protein [Hymenobacter caeli]NRT20250.1 hypothetical protein [Hymenobacter caeli]
MDTVPTAAPGFPPAGAAAAPPAPPAGPTCEAFAVKVGYIWLMVLAPVAGLVLALLNLTAAPSAQGLVPAAALLALGYWAWQRGYRAVQLELRPDALRVRPAAPGRPAQDVPLPRIANYLRPQESYYQILELTLHGGRLRFSKRLRTPAAGLLTLDDWAEALAARLEEARPAAAGALAAADGPARGLAAARPRVLARTAFGKVLAGVATVWALLAAVALLGPGPRVPGWVFMVPALYLGYFVRARGGAKPGVPPPQVLAGSKADRAIGSEDRNNDNTAWMSNG